MIQRQGDADAETAIGLVFKRQRAVELIQQVARVVHGWQDHFVKQGVCRTDMEQLQASIDRDALKIQRVAFL